MYKCTITYTLFYSTCTLSFQAWVHAVGKYPDVFGAGLTPIRLKVGSDTQVAIGANTITTTDGFDSLSHQQRGCLLDSEAPDILELMETPRYCKARKPQEIKRSYHFSALFFLSVTPS